MAKTFNTYDPYMDINGIYKNKKKWVESDAAGDEIGKKQAEQDVKKYYNALETNGFSDVSMNLQNADLTKAQGINNKYAKQNKSAIRPYLYTKGSNYGLSNTDIDNALKYDEDTGEVHFGGKNIGKPYSVVDGVSYWDNEYLDNVIDEYAKNKGLSPSLLSRYDATANTVENRSGQQWDENSQNNNELKEYFKKLLSYATEKTPEQAAQEAYNAAMARFDVESAQARDSSLAKNVSADGSLDSFAAQNANTIYNDAYTKANYAAEQIRQNTYNGRISTIQGIIDSLSGENQRYFDKQSENIDSSQGRVQDYFDNAYDSKQQAFDNSITGRYTKIDEDKNNNEIGRNNSDVTGYIDPRIDTYMQKYLNPDGTLKNPENIDYKAKWDALKDQLANTTDESERENIKREMNALAKAHNMKVAGVKGYSQYDMLPEDYSETYERSRYNADRESGEKIALAGYDTDKYISDKDVDKQKLINEGNVDAIITEGYQDRLTNKSATDDAIRLNNSRGGYTPDKDSISKMDTVVKNINNYLKEMPYYKKVYGENKPDIITSSNGTYRLTTGASETAWRDPIIQEVLKDKSLTEDEATYLLVNCMGFNPDDVTRVYNYTFK